MINFLLTQHYQDLRKLALKLYNGNSYEADDLTQETSLRILEKQNLSPKEPSEFLPWASKVMKNIFLNSLRRKPMADLDDVEEEAPSDNQTISIEDLETLLPENLLECTKLTFSGYTQKEISGLLGIPEGTVKSRMSRVRKIIKDEDLSEKGRLGRR